MVILYNVCENCIRILEEEKHRQFHMFITLWKKFKETGILIVRSQKIVRTHENIVAVAESVLEALSTLVHHCSQQLNISETSLRRILHKYLGMMPYKVQLAQELNPIDNPMRVRFAK